ncbi:glycosyltransferase family protein [Aneurinibacillus terranovensis]|uniref:glycosyltransferase family protein n=1 Tax=Aneurinibacillus terranovensis TaxID=278991 RepID=UPI0003FE54D5|nr:glycosyltransferase [Aneurinibacillus terranovensis]
MRVFHGIIEIAGQMGILSGAMKKRGHIAVGYNIFHSYLGYQEHLINTVQSEISETSKHIMNFFDIFHFHYNSSLLPNLSDLPRLQEKGKKMIMHHWGNDVRFHGQARENNPYVYTGDSPPDEVMHDRLTRISASIRQAIVQDYEVYPYVTPYYEKVHVVPIAIDIRKFVPAYPTVYKGRPLILHAPTNPLFKGTEFVEKAIERLRKDYTFDYKRIERMSNVEATKLYREADIIVDQILCGSYGLLSVESMALGKPVVTFIRPDLVSQFPPELPIINANPDTVYDQIKMLLDNPHLRHQAGINGRKYVEKYHASDVVAERVLAIYENL